MILLAIGSTVNFLFVTVEDKTSRQRVRQGGVVIDKRFNVDSRYATISQQHPERWFAGARLVFGNPRRGNIRRTELSQHLRLR